MDEAVVSTPVLKVGDVARLGEKVPAEVRDLSLGNSPWPGHVREISRMLLKARLLSAGFQLGRFRFGGAECCAVKLASIRIEPERIVSVARRHLESYFPEGGPDVNVELLRKVAPVMVPAAGGQAELRPSLFGTGPPVGTVRVDVDVVRDGVRLKKVPTSFAVRIYDRVAAARCKIGVGEEFSSRNIVFLRRETTRIQGRCVRSLEELSRKTAARAILPGQVLTWWEVRDAQRPVVIERNQRVFLVAQTATLRVVTLGTALGRAREGEIARAKNLSTGREVVGIAVGQGTIEVPIGGAGHEE